MGKKVKNKNNKSNKILIQETIELLIKVLTILYFAVPLYILLKDNRPEDEE